MNTVPQYQKMTPDEELNKAQQIVNGLIAENIGPSATFRIAMYCAIATGKWCGNVPPETIANLAAGFILEMMPIIGKGTRQ